MRTGSAGNGRRPRLTMSAPTLKMCHSLLAVIKRWRQEIARFSVISFSTRARIRTRSHSTSVRSDAKTMFALRNWRLTAEARFSPKSQVRTALDSAYRFNVSCALDRAALKPRTALAREAWSGISSDRWFYLHTKDPFGAVHLLSLLVLRCAKSFWGDLVPP